MFEEITRTERGKNAARRASYVLGSTLFQFLVVVAVVAASAAFRAAVVREPVVEVKFVRTAPPPPPAPPAPPPAARRRPPQQKPRTDLPKPPPPQALIQPKEVQPEMKPPDPNEPPEPEYDSDDRGEGVVGGVVGAPPPQPPQVQDAPAYATTGYRRPQTSVPGCVQRTLHLPPELLDSIEGAITVKFAVGKDGVPSRFEVVTGVHDQRIVNAVWGAVQSCKWIPGADAQGRPVSIWVVMPVRFAF
ncbi:energy transducer TonB [Anaeromyxobacter terrae]|uniref:energy transducer TonB n=1 Tax=Anaeromyxobacter terrae TaxID=2925406 RepID=UPI001F59E39C|nr:energy transducer TonB [Anaeromyxobacter sp. SG22]